MKTTRLALKKRFTAALLSLLMLVQLVPVSALSDTETGELKASETWVVTFSAQGEIVDELLVKAGASLDAAPDAPEVKGSTFEGWTLDGKSVEFPYQPEADVTLTAAYRKDVVLVSSLNGNTSLGQMTCFSMSGNILPQGAKLTAAWAEADEAETEEYLAAAGTQDGKISHILGVLDLGITNPEWNVEGTVRITLSFDRPLKLQPKEALTLVRADGQKMNARFMSGGNEAYGLNFNTDALGRFAIVGAYEDVKTVYTVSFLADQQIIIETREITAGDPIGAFPAAPEKEGWTFAGWNSAEARNPDENTAVQQNMTVYASYEEDYPATVADARTETLSVHVEVPAGALPKDARFVMTAVDSEAYRDAIEKAVDGSVGRIEAADMTFTAPDGTELQPKIPVTVNVTLSGMEEAEALTVVHIRDDGDAEVVAENLIGPEISFQAESFSIYAVVDDSGEENSRIGYRFWFRDGAQDVLLSTQYFRYKDVHPADDSASALSINEPSIPGIDQATWNRIFRGWSKNGYEDAHENLTDVHVLNTELAGIREEDYAEQVIDLYANLENVYYVTYVDVNPRNVLATEIIPVSETGNTVFAVKPAAQLHPTLDSDSELEGWYDLGDPTVVYLPGEENIVISSSLTLYPKVKGGNWLIYDDNDQVWDPDRQQYVSGGASFTPPVFYMDAVTEKPVDPTWTGYAFGGWYTDRECTNRFTFGGMLSSSTILYAKWIPADSAYRVIIWKQRTSDAVGLPDNEKTYDYVTSYLHEDVVTGMNVTLENRYKNIYGTNGSSNDNDKVYFTYNDNRTDKSVVIKADGSSVLNVYYDRKPVTLNYVYTVSANDKDNSPEKYGDVNGQKARIYWKNNAFRTSNNNSGTVYNGTVYTRSSSKAWNTYKSFTGIYGSTLEQNGYSWPAEYFWYANGDKSGGVSGTRTTFMSAFLPTDVDTSGNTVSVDFHGTSPSGSNHIHFLVQNLDGTYTEKDTMTTGNGGFYISDKYIGYHAYQYNKDNGSWTDVGSKNNKGYYNNGNTVSYTSNLYVRFNLNEHDLAFYTNNISNQVVEHTLLYSESLSDYADQNPGQLTGHYFLGWYADPSCTELFNFDQTMPDNNIAVYGLWKLRRTRVVIEPGADNVYIGSQTKSFRVDFDERIDGGMLETATRAGYILDGWYTDPEFTNRFLFTNPVNDDTTDIAWDYQDAAYWSAERTAYGDDDEANDNVRGILHLYAKWIPDTSSTGINVVYDPGDAAVYNSLGTLVTTVPVDTRMYSFDGTTIAREAPSNYSDLYSFKYWEATLKDGTKKISYASDPIELKELQPAETVYDENGDVLRYTVTLTAVYDLIGDPARQTTITFDGNTFTDATYNGSDVELRGRSSDGTQRVSVTLDKEVNQNIELPTAEDFYLDGWELCGWSFTEGTYEAQASAADESAPNFAPGTIVAADNLSISELNDQGNTLYAMWKPKTYTVTVRQVIEADVPQNEFRYTYRTGVENVIGTAQEKSTVLTGNNSSFAVENLEYYSRKGHVINFAVPAIPDDAGYSVRVNAVVEKDDGTTEVLNPDDFHNYRILGNVVITCTYSPKVLVRLQKRDAVNRNTVLTGSVFTLTPVQFNSRTNRWENAGADLSLTVNEATLERRLQEGTYRITETAAPEGYARISTELYLTVNKNSAFTLRAANGGEIDAEIAALDSTGKILTVYDNPIHEVELSKKVVDGAGTTTDTFTFTVTVQENDGDTVRNYSIGTVDGSELITNSIGQVTIRLGDNGSVKFRIPHGFRIRVEETQNSRYRTEYTWNGGAAVSDPTFGFESITQDGTLAYTNTLVRKPLKIRKTGDDAADGLAGAKFSLTSVGTVGGFTNQTGLQSMGGAAENLGYAAPENGTDPEVFNLPVGTYTLSETEAPAYYDGLSGSVTISVTADGIAITAADADSGLVQLSGPDQDGVSTLTINNRRAYADVTVKKTFSGFTAEEIPAGFRIEYLASKPGMTDVNGTLSLTDEGAAVSENGMTYTWTVKRIPVGASMTAEEKEYSAVGYDWTGEAGSDQQTITVTGENDQTIVFTNTYERQTTAVTVRKIWDDNDDQDGYRNAVGATVQLKRQLEGEEEITDVSGMSVSVDPADGNAEVVTWNGLPVYEKGKRITYSVEETMADGSRYTVSYGDAYASVSDETGTLTVTNTHTPETTSVTLKKRWEDAVDASFRPGTDSFAGYVSLSGVEQPPVPVVAGSGAEYTVTWSDLPVYRSGERIAYTVTENAIMYQGSRLYDNGEISGTDGNEYEYQVTNTRKTAQVYLGKQVTGNMGDRGETFRFAVTVKDGRGNEMTFAGITDETADVTRKHGAASLLGTFPVGVEVTITELEGAAGYSTGVGSSNTASDANAERTSDAKTITFRVSDQGNTITFYNDKEVKVDTGVPMESRPYWLLLAIAAMGIAAMGFGIYRRRRFE